jgi:hypothetical protein
MARSINGNLRPGGPGHRTGRRHKQIRRALIAAAGKPISTADFVEAVYPRAKILRSWHWRKVRLSAERYAERIMPRSRPLRWKLKTDISSAYKQTKSKT